MATQVNVGSPTQLAVSEWLTASEAAQYLKVKPRTLLLWARQGKVKGYAVSGTQRRFWRFRREDLDTMMMGGSVLASLSPSVRSERTVQ